MTRPETMGRGDRLQFSAEDGHLYDVVAVDLHDSQVRVIEKCLTLPNAEAVIVMAVMRRGCDKEFFAEVPSGFYKDGQTWKGTK